MTSYRKIYEQYYGPIPVDSDGRKYEIHHTDGNHKNDLPENLKAITIQEHYDIHYSRGDWNACLRIAARIKLAPKVFSDLARNNNLKRVASRSHPFQTRSDGTNLQTDRVADRTHNFLGPDTNLKKVEEGTHPFLGGEIQRKTCQSQLDTGTHPFLRENRKKISCPYCLKIGDERLMKRYHFDNCKLKEI